MFGADSPAFGAEEGVSQQSDSHDGYRRDTRPHHPFQPGGLGQVLLVEPRPEKGEAGLQPEAEQDRGDGGRPAEYLAHRVIIDGRQHLR